MSGSGSPGFDLGTQGPSAAPVQAPGAKTRQRIGLTCTSTDGSTVIGVGCFGEVEIERDLRDMAGRFSMTVFDLAREYAAGTIVASGAAAGSAAMIAQGMQVAITIDGALVLAGRLDKITLHGDANSDTMTIHGRDATCGLVDCAAAPNGPTEFRNQTLTQIATTICAPFGIRVTAQTDVGAPFVLASLNQHDTAHAFLEGLARQRATLLASDGVGGLLLTAGGSAGGAAALVRGQNILAWQCTRDWSKRFSDYYVKGQTNSSGYATGGAGMTHATAPGAVPVDSGYGKPTILMTGHAIDPQIIEYRPTVRLTRSQSGMATTQDQAEWALRVAQGEADELLYTVLDWRAGPNGALWMPNTVVLVNDPLVGIDQDMLIAGVKYKLTNEVAQTELRVVGLTAYDLTNLAATRKTNQNKQQVLQSGFESLYQP